MEDPLNIAICEDTKSDEEKLIAILEKSSFPVKITVFHSGEELISGFEPQKFDLLLSDIYMDGMTGIQAVSKIRELDGDIPVAFITTSTDFALESYRLSALRYIEKPYQEEKIADILRLALMTRNSTPALTVKKNGRERRIRYSQVVCMEQQVHQVDIHLKDGSVEEVYDSLSALEPELLEHNFVIPHKSYAVNLACVVSIDPELRCFVMQNGENIPIRRESMGKAKQALRDYLFSITRNG